MYSRATKKQVQTQAHQTAKTPPAPQPPQALPTPQKSPPPRLNKIRALCPKSLLRNNWRATGFPSRSNCTAMLPFDFPRPTSRKVWTRPRWAVLYLQRS